MKTTITKIVSIRPLKDTFITAIEFNDGGQLGVATGVGKFGVGDPIIVYMDDRYNRLKFKLAIT